MQGEQLEPNRLRDGLRPGEALRKTSSAAVARPIISMARGRAGRLAGALFVIGLFALVGAEAAAQPRGLDDDENERLGEKLIRTAGGDANEDVMDGLVRLMDGAARRLEIELDAGSETQTLQERIVARLDEAIALAASRQRAVSRSEQPTQGDKRRAQKTAKDRPRGSGDSAGGSEADSLEGATQSGRPAQTDVHSGGRLEDSRRTWGNLPAREREEVIQGAGERSIERFREWIERYYRALQESGESRPGSPIQLNPGVEREGEARGEPFPPAGRRPEPSESDR